MATSVPKSSSSTVEVQCQQRSTQLPAFLQQSKADLHAKFVDLEWQQRNRLLQGTQPPANPSDPPSQWARLTGDHIVSRNRYLNVEPYAQNRVKLPVPEGHNDYINASPITLGKRRYIATQGPKETSVNHFYRMIASDELSEPVVVVMLTQTHDAGREKCFQYFPLAESNSPLKVNSDQGDVEGFTANVSLQSVKHDAASNSEVRHLKLESTTANNSPINKSLHHLLFSGWPDFLTPEGDDRTALIELIALSARLNSPSNIHDQSNPRIVHCSAGVGRTGTFIALDYLLHLHSTGELANLPKDSDPILEVVDALRQQRMMMVQGENQFYFLYEILREVMLAEGGTNS